MSEFGPHEHDDGRDVPQPTDVVIDSLLSGLHEPDEVAHQRLQTALAAFDREHLERPRPIQRDWIQTVGVVASIAATLLIGCFGIWTLLGTTSAEAAIARTQQTFQRPVIRVYDVEIRLKRQTQPITRNATLLSHSANQFLLRFDDALVEPVLIGANERRRWMRIGSRIWRSDQGDSDDQFLRSMMLDRITMRQLQFNRLLTDLPVNYHLKKLPDEMIGLDELPPGHPATGPLHCYRVEALRRVNLPFLPTSMTLWIDSATDITQRIEVNPHPRSRRGIERYVATYRGDRPLQPEVFQLENYR